ncbi:MAG TPA: hypothetical protein GX513_02915 [Firmicutes bacterium]|nr:hypothetical protein [Bacillota bacterium]
MFSSCDLDGRKILPAGSVSCALVEEGDIVIDGHLHIDLMSYGDIDEMLRRGIEGAVSCAYVQGASASSTLFDHFRLLAESYLALAARAGFVTAASFPMHRWVWLCVSRKPVAIVRGGVR